MEDNKQDNDLINDTKKDKRLSDLRERLDRLLDDIIKVNDRSGVKLIE